MFVKLIAKPFLMMVIVAEIVSIFVMLHVYNKFMDDPKNFASPVVIAHRSSNKKTVAEMNKIIEDLDAGQTALPKKFLIKNVPFSVQSPDSKWDEYGEESCEEASEIIVNHFWKQTPLDRATMLRERNALIDFEIRTYGDFRDEDAEQIVQRLKDYFGYQNVRVVYDFSLEDLKTEIVKGRPIIIPAAGRLLNNPFFKQPGPLYHNLVVIGFDGKDVITNDPGIGRGEGYRYNENILYNAIHDFPGSLENMEQGRKAMIIVEGE